MWSTRILNSNERLASEVTDAALQVVQHLVGDGTRDEFREIQVLQRKYHFVINLGAGQLVENKSAGKNDTVSTEQFLLITCGFRAASPNEWKCYWESYLFK